MSLLAASETGGRVVFISSSLANSPTQKDFEHHFTDIGGENSTEVTMGHYNMSKLLDSMYAYELQKRLASHEREEYRKVVVCAADPGMVKTTSISKMESGE